ncbi:MAG: DUF952 domain-containing protein [Caulobacteraceae bacterium]|nr:DUF952 domain-containing protein [Caulobacter sp.]
MSRAYKILAAREWEHALAAGVYEGSAIDLADGFIHFSTAEQTPETAARHFRGREGLLLLEVETVALGSSLRWEPSRGGALFPHLYGALPVSAVLEVHPFPLGQDGVPAAQNVLRR